MKKKSQVVVLSLVTILITVWLFSNFSPLKAKESSDENLTETVGSNSTEVDASKKDSSDNEKNRDLVNETSSSSSVEEDQADSSNNSEKYNNIGARVGARAAGSGFNNLSDFNLASDGTGIVAHNLGKTMSDIQSYNGDSDAIKQMIIKESQAKAYGLVNGAVSDVTSQIQINDLNGLDTVSSNELQEFHIEMTVPASAAGTENDLSSEVIVYIGKISVVSTWAQFNTAMTTNDVQIISVQSNMTNSSAARADINISSKKNYVILGNGYSIDFIGYSYWWPSDLNTVHNAVVDNLDMYGGNYYGPVTMWNENKIGSSITYRNSNYSGSQLTASFQATLRFEGKNIISSQNTSYVSYDGTTKNMANTQQAGIESHTTVIAENSDTTIQAVQGDALILGSYYSNTGQVASVQPSLTLEEGAKLKLRTTGNAGETNSWGNTSTGNIYSVINLQRNGRIDVGKNAQLTAESADSTTRVLVQLGYNNRQTQWTSSINLSENSVFNVNANGPIVNNGTRAGIMMQQNSQINIAKNATMNVNATKMTTGAPLISMGTNSQFNVAQGGQLNINKNGGTGRMLNLSSGSKFSVQDDGGAKFVSLNEGTSTSSMIYGGNGSNFTIGNKGTFEANIQNGTGIRNMLDFGANTVFQFSNAQKIDLDARGNTNVNLVNMTNPGTFSADIQAVSAWNKADSTKEDPSYMWTPMYGMAVTYNGINTTKVAANSVTTKMQNDFITNYRTEKFSRVLFDYIPDVVIGFDQPSDNKTIESGQKLTGVVNNNALIIFYKVVDETDASTDVLLTDPTIVSPVDGDDRKFHTVADGNGKFSYTIPDDVELKAGEKIKAYAWLDGKDSSAIQTVLDKTPPSGDSVTYEVALNDPVPDASVFVKDASDTNPTTQNFTYQFNAETPLETIQQDMKVVGEYTVKIDLTDEAGNTTVITSKLVVHPYGQYITGDTFETNREEIKSMSDAELIDYIVSNSKASAYKVSDGVQTDLSKFITVTDFGGLNDYDSLTPKDYTIELTVKAADSGLTTDISTKITVTVVQSIGTITAEFLDEKGNSILDPVSIEGIIGQTVDLSADSSIKDALSTVEQKNYDLNQRPTNETAVPVTSEGTTVKYMFKGMLFIKSQPKDLDFGIKSVGNETTKIDKATYDTPLVIWDNRAELTSWTLTAQLEDPLRNQVDTTKILPNAIQYKVDSKTTIPISVNDAQPITVHTHDVAGEYNISSEWDKGDTGFQLEIPAGGVRKLGEYQTTILWQLGETP